MEVCLVLIEYLNNVSIGLRVRQLENISAGAMTGLSRINFEAFAAKFDFSKFKTLCDVGGATGLLCIEVAKKHPHLHFTSFDLPPVEPIAKKHIAAAVLSDRVKTAGGAFLNDPTPSC